MKLWRTRFFSFDVRCLGNKHKHKQIKMTTKLDGSEASMLPVLIKNSYELLGQKSQRNLVNIQEFSVGRGIADLFVIEKDQTNLAKRKKSNTLAATKLNHTPISDHCHPAGVANVIKQSIAIEAKVRDWRKGLKQATRYKTFANKSYLALYDSHVKTPLNFLDIFEALNIGLIGVTDDTITVYFEPKASQPNEEKYHLASERAYSVIDDTQDSFVVRNQLVAGSVAA